MWNSGIPACYENNGTTSVTRYIVTRVNLTIIIEKTVYTRFKWGFSLFQVQEAFFTLHYLPSPVGSHHDPRTEAQAQA